MRRLLAIFLLMFVFGFVSALPAQAKTYKNCADLRNVYKYGISLSVKTVNSGAGPIFTPRASASVFKLNARLDLDKDKIVCEVVKPTSTSMPRKPPISDLTLTPFPTIAGVARVGNTLTAVPGTWDPGVTLSYQWLRNGFAIAGETAKSYTLKAEDGGTATSVEVTGSKSGFYSAVRTGGSVRIPIPTGPVPSAAPTQVPTPTPTPTPSPKPTQTPTPIPIPSTSSLPIPSASPSPLPSNSVSPSQPPLGTLSRTPKPTITGADTYVAVGGHTVAGAGTLISAVAGTWDTGVSLAYQWFRNATPIPGGTASTYTLREADDGQQISVSVTGSKSGFQSVQVISDNVSVTSPCRRPEPALIGDVRVGTTISIAMSGNCLYQSFTVEWFRGGTLVSQPGKSYTLTSTDLGAQISAWVTPIGNRFTMDRKYLGPVVVRGRLFTLAPVPLISGGNQAGSVLTVDAGAWDSGTSLQYQWLRNGSLISGAVGPTYTIQALDADQSITCRVAASKDAYESTERESLAVRVLAQTFTQTGAPRISGDNVVGGAVMVFRGTWDDGVSFTYQWMRNGQAISGATSLNYVFKPEDAGQSITVQVTGSKVGFSTVTKESRAVIPTSR